MKLMSEMSLKSSLLQLIRESAPNHALLSPPKLTIAEMEVPHGGAHCVNDNGPGSTGENVELTVGPLEAPSLWSCGVGHQFHPNDAEKMYGCLLIGKTLENGALHDDDDAGDDDDDDDDDVDVDVDDDDDLMISYPRSTVSFCGALCLRSWHIDAKFLGHDFWIFGFSKGNPQCVLLAADHKDGEFLIVTVLVPFLQGQDRHFKFPFDPQAAQEAWIEGNVMFLCCR